MNTIDLQIDSKLDLYLSEIISDPPDAKMIAVLIGPVPSIPEIQHVGNDVVNLGFYPEQEDKWVYAVKLQNGFIRLGGPLAESLKAGGKQLKLREIIKNNGELRKEIYLATVTIEGKHE